MSPRRRPFLLSATVDFPDDLEIGVYATTLLHDAMRLLRTTGVRRVHWLDYGSVDRSSPLFNPILLERTNGPATIANLGDPLRAAVAAAHANGMELFAVLKPFASRVLLLPLADSMRPSASSFCSPPRIESVSGYRNSSSSSPVMALRRRWSRWRGRPGDGSRSSDARA